jgi:hypothetical protein
MFKNILRKIYKSLGYSPEFWLDQPMNFSCDYGNIPNNYSLYCDTPPANWPEGVRIFCYYRKDMPNNRAALDAAGIPVIGSYETSSPAKACYYVIPSCNWSYEWELEKKK